MKHLKILLRRRHYGRAIAFFLIYVMFLNISLPVAWAGPEGAQVINGNVSIQQSAYNTTITASDKAIINYSSFDIARPETVQFIQPSSSASVLNRILSANPTNINGTLLANGRVFFVNPAGIYIGAGARINVNQLVASGLNISNSDFINGRYNFAGGDGSVINSGDVSAEKVYLIGKQVTNSGNISCPAGYVVMTAGDRVFLGEPGSEIVLEMDAPSPSESADAAGSGAGVLNEGTVEAAGGIIALAAAGDIYSQAISNVGSLSTSVETGNAGEVKLISPEGTVVNSGSIEATSSSGTGGTVQMLGDRVGLFDAAEIDVSGSEGGGVVLVGGDYQGKGDAPTASRAYVSPDSSIRADATENGDGGTVIVWADEITGFYGNIVAHGGPDTGDGGFVEVSSKKFLDFEGDVDVGCLNGTMGTILLDPRDITIEDAGSSTGDGELSDDQVLFGDDSGGGATSDDFAISDTALNALSGNVVLQANRDVTQNTDADISLTTVGQSLTIQAGENITLNATVTTNSGDIHLEADSPHSTSDTGMAPADGSGTLTVGGSVSSAGGNITLVGADFSISSTVNAGSGGVNISQSQSGQAFGLGTAAGAILTDAELDNITTTGTLTIGQATTKGTDGAGTNPSTLTSGAITLDDLTQGAKDTALVSNSTINDDDDAGAAIATSGTLTLTAGGAIGNLGGAAGLNTDVGTLALTTTGGNNSTVTEADGLDLATSNVGGNLGVTATTGSITINGSLTAGGSYDISAASGVVFGATGKVTGSAPSTITAVTGSIANTGSDETTTIETTGAGSNLTLTAGNASTQSTRPMTIVSSGNLTVNAPLDNTSSTTTLSSADDLAINRNITDATAISAHAGTDGTGGVTFGAGVTLDAPIVTLRAGDGLGGDTTAQVEITTNTPTIVANSALTIEQDGQMGTKDDPMTVPDEDDPWNPDVTNNATIDLNLKSYDSSIYTTNADSWQSITATAENNIELWGSGDIRIASAGLSSASGGVKVISDGGTISTPGASGALDAPITGSSNQAGDIGVGLPFDDTQKAAIVISSEDDLILETNAGLTANGSYDPVANDDRGSVDFDTSLTGGGDPLDVAIYLRSSRLDPSQIGTVTVNSTVQIADNGSMVVDAGERVVFGDEFGKSVFNQTQRLEVVSRISTFLDEVISYDRLPFADNPDALRTWFSPPGSFTGAYVLRGKELFAEILALANPVPLVPPRPLEPDVGGEVEGPDTEALEALLNELGIGVQPYVTEAYAASLSTDLRLYRAAEKLQQLIPILEDADGTGIAALRATVAQFFPSLDALSEEQVSSFAQELVRHKGDGTDYDVAGQCILALTEYVTILGNDVGWPVEKSVGFVMGRYVPRLTEGDEIRIAVIQMQLQEALGV